MQVDFYQLTRDPAEKVLPFIAQRVLDDKGRLLIVSATVHNWMPYRGPYGRRRQIAFWRTPSRARVMILFNLFCCHIK